jgi:hypothetical protein
MSMYDLVQWDKCYVKIKVFTLEILSENLEIQIIIILLH